MRNAHVIKTLWVVFHFRLQYSLKTEKWWGNWQEFFGDVNI